MANESGSPSLGAGRFYGASEFRKEQCGAIFTILRHVAPRKLPSHSHQLPFVALLLDGLYGERYRGRDQQFCPFTAHFRPAGVPHQDEIGPKGVRFFEIEIRPTWARHLQECSATLDRAHDDCHGGQLFWLSMKLLGEVYRSGAGEELAVESLLSELVAAAGGDLARPCRERPRWLARVLDLLAAQYSEPISLAELSREADVHPVHLSRVFRHLMGKGVGDYLRHVRVRAACERMLKPQESLAEISVGLGFADQSHFTRSFRRVTGMTPTDFRTRIAGDRSRRSDPNPVARVGRDRARET